MKKMTKVAVFVAVAVVAVGGIAAALWSSTGTGPGQARATSAQAITVSAATGPGELYPGFTGGDVYFTLTNTNPYPVTFTSMTAGAVTSSDTTACPSANVTATGATGLSLTVGANSTSGTLSIPDVITMLSSAPDGCQAKTFNVALTLTGAQS